ncbi:MAG: hypothetical protein ACYDCK_12195 [Thermoplasmatota archaeon]
MTRTTVLAALAVACLAAAPAAAAHSVTTTQGISFRIGWDNEPPTTGTKNAVTVWVFDNASERAVTHITDLKITVAEAGKTKTLLATESDEAPGNYSAAILPTAPGVITLNATATVGGKALSVSGVKLDEVQSAADIAFPSPLVDTSDLQTQVQDLQTQVTQLKSTIATLQSAGAAATKATPGFDAPLAFAALALALVVAARRTQRR